MFFCEFSENFHNSFFTEHLRTAFSVIVLFFKFTEATNYILTFSFDFAEQYVYVDIFIKWLLLGISIHVFHFESEWNQAYIMHKFSSVLLNCYLLPNEKKCALGRTRWGRQETTLFLPPHIVFVFQEIPWLQKFKTLEKNEIIGTGFTCLK